MAPRWLRWTPWPRAGRLRAADVEQETPTPESTPPARDDSVETSDGSGARRDDSADARDGAGATRDGQGGHRALFRALDVVAVAVIVVIIAGSVALALRDSSGGPVPTVFPSSAVTNTPSPVPTSHAGDWPTYGYDYARARFNPAIKLRPPFRVKWKYDAGDLLEFPPSIVGDRLYFETGHGLVICADAATGDVIWRHRIGGYLASSPTVENGVVYVSSMGPRPTESSTKGGALVALNAETGKVLWKWAGIGPSESSPLVWRKRVFIGDRDKKLYAIDLPRMVDGRTVGKPRLAWTFAAKDRFNASPALLDRRIVIGSYDGTVYCLNYAGKLLWKNHVSRYLLSSDAFYATAALAYNTAYIGSLGREVFAFDLSNGGIRWSYTTGGWVYSSAAVWRGIVFVGSYDQVFYALDARTGKRRWSFSANSPISGSATVIDGVVYFSTLAGRTLGLNARNGKQLWKFRDGRYTPVTATTTTVYLCGKHTIYALEPKR
ncbi:MAG TPA: PQQ-binding-like beta-propeller repeat protein [Thermoleophilia bacterium]|nr:PQQ-binding-like beta-propeller repeat protein [Thermoleophilia bacterium]